LHQGEADVVASDVDAANRAPIAVVVSDLYQHVLPEDER